MNTPTFEELLLQRTYGVNSIESLNSENDAEDVKAILAAHTQALEAARREVFDEIFKLKHMANGSFDYICVDDIAELASLTQEQGNEHR